MRGLVLFVAGILVGAAVQTTVAQNERPGVVGLNHVGVAVPDIPAAAAYYTEKLGFKEAFRNSDPKDSPRRSICRSAATRSWSCSSPTRSVLPGSHISGWSSRT